MALAPPKGSQRGQVRFVRLKASGMASGAGWVWGGALVGIYLSWVGWKRGERK